MLSILRNADTTPKICIENNAASVIRDYLKLGVGSAIIPTKTWKNIWERPRC